MKPNNKQISSSLPSSLLSIRSLNEPNDINNVKPNILHQCPNYIVINKPHDIRMDGDFTVTIQKLLLKWIPESTLDSIKWVHQLDYATSGVLCIARNKDSAAIANSSFANRCTNKQYIAILQGRLLLDQWPLMNHRLKVNEQSDDMIETKKRKGSTDDGWQQDIMNQNLISNYDAFQTILKSKESQLNTFISNENANRKINKRLSSNNITDEDIFIFSKYTLDDYRNDSKLRKGLRKILKANGVDIDQIPSIGNSNSIDNDNEVIEIKKPSEVWLQGLYKPSENSVYRINENGKEKLIIAIPVAEVDGDFRCEPGYEQNPGKISETEVEILEYGEYKNHEITKVKFTPITGRRHQLRVHAKCIGHPICGDGTYNEHPLTDIAERMFLHAYRLQLRLPSNYLQFLGKNTTYINSDQLTNDNHNKVLISVQTEDPFPVNNNQLFFT